MQLTGGIAPELASDLTFTVFVSSISTQKMGDGEAIKRGYYNWSSQSNSKTPSGVCMLFIMFAYLVEENLISRLLF